MGMMNYYTKMMKKLQLYNWILNAFYPNINLRILSEKQIKINQQFDLIFD